LSDRISRSSHCENSVVEKVKIVKNNNNGIWAKNKELLLLVVEKVKIVKE
jgi:hypothetical protein